MSQIDAAVVIDVKRLQRVFLELQAMGDDGKGLSNGIRKYFASDRNR